MPYIVSGGALNSTQSNPIHGTTLPAILESFKVFRNFHQMFKVAWITSACTSARERSTRTSFTRANNPYWNNYGTCVIVNAASCAFPAFRNATHVFFAQQKMLHVLFTQPHAPQRRLRIIVALHRQIETTPIFPQSATPDGRRRTTFNHWLRHCGCGTSLCVALRCVVENAHYSPSWQPPSAMRMVRKRRLQKQ